ncbi:MAG: hypothetical protein H6573_00080 [Lewinellaceae bacterium]|nr:hypothetical protein [Phaeodactylibacter sp.]MCB9345893.1 hypothetical protein [Lewinellaceae bacterium]
MLPVNEVMGKEHGDCRAVSAWLSGLPGQMALVMRVNKEALSPAMCRKYFAGDGFEIEEDFIIPQPIKAALGVDRERIGRGLCGMEESDDFYDVFL